MAGWDSLKQLVKDEITERMEEGCNVSGYIEKWAEANDNYENLMKLYYELQTLVIDKEFPYTEPSELNEIRKERPEGPRLLINNLSDEQLKDKFLGAWLGRIAGCALGKPLECAPFMFSTNGKPGWENIQLWFQGANAWPIANYTPSESSAKAEFGFGLSPWCKKSELSNIKFMESDDDIRYTVIGLAMLEEKGAGFDTWDVGKMWHSKLTYSQVCTAETQAYLNFAQVTQHTDWSKPSDLETKIAWVRTYLNPYREWIGAQIRVDGYAYGAACNPELAAEFAWKDASLSHVKNGIYGAMFISAIIASAFVENDAHKLIEIGLSEIPKNCRLSKDIKKAIEIADSAKDQLDLVGKIYKTFKHYHSVHTNNNAALCAAAIIFANGDYEKAITTAVLGGWDTDCNGATVGSIMGAMVGASKIPEHWTKPLNDTLYSDVIGFHPIKISECAERSYKTYLKIKNHIL